MYVYIIFNLANKDSLSNSLYPYCDRTSHVGNALDHTYIFILTYIPIYIPYYYVLCMTIMASKTMRTAVERVLYSKILLLAYHVYTSGEKGLVTLKH